MPPFDYPNPGAPLQGSVDWGAARILRLMEDEERRRRMAWAGRARHSTYSSQAPSEPDSDFSMDAVDPLAPSLSEGGQSDGIELYSGQPVAWSNSGGTRHLVRVGVSRAPMYPGSFFIPSKSDPLFTPEEGAEMAFSMIPVVGDAYGLVSDLDTYINEPESRTWTNFGLTGIGVLPFVPGGMTKIVGKAGKKLEDVLAANPRAKIEDIPADATGRLGRPITRETVIRVADHLQNQFDKHEPGRFALIAGGGRRERAIAPVGYDGYKATRLSEGSRFGDIMFLDTKTGKQFIFQIARMDANGRPIAAELDAALQISRTPTRIPGPYRKVDDLMGLDIQPGHTVVVITPPANW